MGRIEILGSVERRRRWRPEDKVAILDEAFGEGGTVAAASEHHGVSRALIYYWRRQAREGAIPGVGMVTADAPVFVPARIEAPAGPPEPTPPAALPRSSAPARRCSTVEVALGNGRTVKVDETIDPATLARLVAVLDGGRS